ncbi:hypothetical protein HanXRQr2_Chr09g0388131 [Helianthus annuus]|uniref:Uncharacterized protein n=1 Tax=Helianthus annuus TaxID=4232 RepID=A0A9K3N898_HELAN|nr:hypothetical protein HanXRQr2_Chr09g0388131 [Helianthus annuus]
MLLNFIAFEFWNQCDVNILAEASKDEQHQDGKDIVCLQHTSI